MYKVTIEHFPDGTEKSGGVVGVLTLVNLPDTNLIYRKCVISLQDKIQNSSISSTVMEHIEKADSSIWKRIRHILKEVL